MVVGTIVGWALPAAAVTLKPLATIFLRLIKSLVVPLVFSTLVVGIAGHGDDLKRVGRLALGTLVYFEIMTTIALVFGLVAGNVARPGAGVAIGAPTTTGPALGATKITLAATLEHLVPQSIPRRRRERRAAGRRVRSDLRHRSGAGAWQPARRHAGFCQSLAEVTFKMVGCDALCADRHRRGDRRDDRAERPRCPHRLGSSSSPCTSR